MGWILNFGAELGRQADEFLMQEIAHDLSLSLKRLGLL